VERSSGPEGYGILAFIGPFHVVSQTLLTRHDRHICCCFPSQSSTQCWSFREAFIIWFCDAVSYRIRAKRIQCVSFIYCHLKPYNLQRRFICWRLSLRLRPLFKLCCIAHMEHWNCNDPFLILL
jgi:hypothetical protein